MLLEIGFVNFEWLEPRKREKKINNGNKKL